MDVFALDRSVVSDYSAFARSFTSVKSEDLRRSIDDTYKTGRFWPEPLLQLNPCWTSYAMVRWIQAVLRISETSNPVPP
jgi:hypothetical protein